MRTINQVCLALGPHFYTLCARDYNCVLIMFITKCMDGKVHVSQVEDRFITAAGIYNVFLSH